MAEKALSVDGDFRNLIRCADVQQDSAPVELFRQGEAAAVPQGCSFREMLPDAGQPGFRTEGHQNGLARKFRLSHSKLPFAV